MATSRVDTYVPESPYCTYGLRVPAHPACLRTKGAGQLAPVPHALYVRCTRTSLGRAVRTGRTVAHPTGYEYEYEPAQHIVPQLETEQPLRPSSAYW